MSEPTSLVRLGWIEGSTAWAGGVVRTDEFQAPRIQQTAQAGDELITLPVAVDIVTGPAKHHSIGARWLPPLFT
jgi:hypothetical protein